MTRTREWEIRRRLGLYMGDSRIIQESWHGWNWGVDYMYVKLSEKQVLEKCDFSLKVLEKYLKRKVWGLYEPCPKSIILGQMTNLNMIFHVVVSVYFIFFLFYLFIFFLLL